MTKEIDLTNKRFERVLVLRKDLTGHGDIRTRWICRCDCGKEWSVRGTNLRAGNTKSCGCLSRSQHLTHGRHASPEYLTWRSMMKRCNNSTSCNYEHYGGRGITVCSQWSDFDTFYKDMGPRPTKLHTLDRIDNERGYEPDNCRWATRKQQSRNRRVCVRVKFAERDMTLSEAIELSGLNRNTVYYRKKVGWPKEFWFIPSGSRLSHALHSQ